MMYKCCPKCGKKIEYSLKYCEECSKTVEQQKRKRYRDYKAKRMQDVYEKQLQEFYNSVEWKRVRESTISRYFYLDIYSYYEEGTIEYGYTLHHIIPIRNNWNSRLDTNNLIYLTEKNHQMIHKMLDKDYEGTVCMLQELVKRWNKEFRSI